MVVGILGRRGTLGCAALFFFEMHRRPLSPFFSSCCSTWRRSVFFRVRDRTRCFLSVGVRFLTPKPAGPPNVDAPRISFVNLPLCRSVFSDSYSLSRTPWSRLLFFLFSCRVSGHSFFSSFLLTLFFIPAPPDFERSPYFSPFEAMGCPLCVPL